MCIWVFMCVGLLQRAAPEPVSQLIKLISYTIHLQNVTHTHTHRTSTHMHATNIHGTGYIQQNHFVICVVHVFVEQHNFAFHRSPTLFRLFSFPIIMPYALWTCKHTRARAYSHVYLYIQITVITLFNMID